MYIEISLHGQNPNTTTKQKVENEPPNHDHTLSFLPPIPEF